MPDKLKELQELFDPEAARVRRVRPLDNTTLRALERAKAESQGGTQGFHVLRRIERRAEQRCTEHPRQVRHHHRRGHDPERRRGRHDRH